MRRRNLTKKVAPVAALGLAAALVLVNDPGGTAANQEDIQFSAVGRDFATTETVALRSFAVESNSDELTVFLNDPSLRPVVLQGTGQSDEAAGVDGNAVVHDPASIMGIFDLSGQESEASDLTVVVQDPASISLTAGQASSEAESDTVEFIVHNPANVGGPAVGGSSSESESESVSFVQQDAVTISEGLGGGPSVEAGADDGQFVRHDPASLGGPLTASTSSESESEELTVVQHGPDSVDSIAIGASASESGSSSGNFVQHGNRVRTIALQDQATQSESESVLSGVVVHEPGQVTIAIPGGRSGESEAAEGTIVDQDLITIAQGLRASSQTSESSEASDGGFEFTHPSWFDSGFTIGSPTSEADSADATFVLRGGTDLTEIGIEGEVD